MSCTNLTTINIPDGITTIRWETFHGCSSLKKIVLSDNVTRIDEGAFWDCTNLVSLTIKNQYCSIGGTDFTSSTARTLGVAGTTVIYGYENSTAEAFAEKHGFDFVALDAHPVEGDDLYTGYGSIKIGVDTYNFENYSTTIYANVYKDTLGTTKGLSLLPEDELSLQPNGKYGKEYGGVCAGFVNTTIATDIHHSPSLNGYGVSVLHDVNQNTLNSENNLTVDEYIQRGQIYQFSPYFSKAVDENLNDLQSLYDAVEAYCNGDDGVFIYISGVINEHGAHALLALGITENNADKTTIAVYDCNHPDEEQSLFLYKNADGKYVSWEYVLGIDKDTQQPITWGSGRANAKISHVESGLGFTIGIIDEIKMSLLKLNGDCVAYSDKESDFIPIMPANVVFDEEGNFVVDDYEGEMYWVSDDTALTISAGEEGGEIILCDDGRIAVELPAGAELEVLVDSDGKSYANVIADAEQVVSISYETINKTEDDFIPITVTATGSIQTSLEGVELSIHGSDVIVSDIENSYHLDTENATIQLSEDLTKIELLSDGSTITPTEPDLKLGDVNGDGAIDASDAAEILVEAALLGAGYNGNFTEEQFSSADVNDDGVVDVSDSAVILVYSAMVGAGYTDVKIEELV